MAELTFQCQVCRTPLTADESQVGTLVRCPVCKTALRVPSAARSMNPPQPVGAGAAAGTVVTTSAAGGAARQSNSAPTSTAGPQQRRVTIPSHLLPPRDGPGKRYGFNCVYCSSRLEANEGMAAQEGQCPTCGNTITIP